MIVPVQGESCSADAVFQSAIHYAQVEQSFLSKAQCAAPLIKSYRNLGNVAQAKKHRKTGQARSQNVIFLGGKGARGLFGVRAKDLFRGAEHFFLLFSSLFSSFLEGRDPLLGGGLPPPWLRA